MPPRVGAVGLEQVEKGEAYKSPYPVHSTQLHRNSMGQIPAA